MFMLEASSKDEIAKDIQMLWNDGKPDEDNILCREFRSFLIGDWTDHKDNWANPEFVRWKYDQMAPRMFVINVFNEALQKIYGASSSTVRRAFVKAIPNVRDQNTFNQWLFEKEINEVFDSMHPDLKTKKWA